MAAATAVVEGSRTRWLPTLRSVTAMQFMPEGQTLVASHGSGLLLADAVTGAVVRERDELHKADVVGIAVAPSGRQLAAFAYERHVCLWDAETLECIAELHSHAYMLCVAYSADSSTVATGAYEGVVRLWRAADGKPLAVLRSPDLSTAVSLCFTDSNNTRLLAGGYVDQGEGGDLAGKGCRGGRCNSGGSGAGRPDAEDMPGGIGGCGGKF
eukprot:m.151989 g.151989  ORF g.151989 m.151989 type:complete len:212 (+) comp16909_c2_seq4:39-674(+)